MPPPPTSVAVKKFISRKKQGGNILKARVSKPSTIVGATVVPARTMSTTTKASWSARYRRAGVARHLPLTVRGKLLASTIDKRCGATASTLAAAVSGAERRPVLVWDLPTRVFHWLAVVLVAAAYLTWRLNWMDWHAWVGDALLALLVFRLLWGLFGSETARFSSFVAPPRTAVQHLAHILRRDRDLQAGHNPAGGWMVMFLLALLLGQTLTGLYVSNDVANEGPLTELSPARIANMMTALHDVLLWNALLAAVALHVLAILVYSLAKRHDLLLPMITGRKMLPDSVPAPCVTRPTRALVFITCAAVAAAAIAYYL
jgi:cytochrome b